MSMSYAMFGIFLYPYSVVEAIAADVWTCDFDPISCDRKTRDLQKRFLGKLFDEVGRARPSQDQTLGYDVDAQIMYAPTESAGNVGLPTGNLATSLRTTVQLSNHRNHV
jgi:hypothetical protein